MIDKRNQRLVKTYGITADEYDHMLEQQLGVCKICFSAPKTRRLSTDHDHAWKQIRVITVRDMEGGWHAYARYRSTMFNAQAPMKRAAVADVKAQLKKASVRGLLCPNCNRGLQRFFDRPESFDNAARYLREFEMGYVVNV